MTDEEWAHLEDDNRVKILDQVEDYSFKDLFRVIRAKTPDSFFKTSTILATSCLLQVVHSIILIRSSDPDYKPTLSVIVTIQKRNSSTKKICYSILHLEI